MLKRQIVAPFRLAAKALILIEKMIIAVLNSVLRLLGIKPMPVPSRALPQLSIKPEDILSEVRKDGSEVGLPTSDKLLKPTSDAGHTLYRYACAKSAEERSTMDLSALSPDQQDWLLMLSDADLDRLARVGLDGCTRAMEGKRCGVGGLPKLDKKEPAETPKTTSPLANRIYNYRAGPAFA
ncbi:hypothetical protein D7027_02210 [Ochrobactrum intermedium]|uniref:hypothetical protein n=1 Tax=Brucella intermedia TaxID=94625 RepID=UPI00128CF8A9|nr:hypothetical protein [Brucella intermedia]MPR60646.1 hypothetical protein [Brucella intermedia]